MMTRIEKVSRYQTVQELEQIHWIREYCWVKNHCFDILEECNLAYAYELEITLIHYSPR